MFRTTSIALEPPELREKSAVKRKVLPGLPRPFFLGMAVGSRGSGKTTAVIQLLKMLDQTQAVDRIYLWSPTYESDLKQQLLEKDKHSYELRVLGTFTNEDFEDVAAEIQTDLQEYDEYERLVKVWKAFMKCKDPRKLSAEVLEDLEQMDWKPPTTEFKHGRPVYTMVFDDQVGNKSLYSANCKSAFTRFAVIHRHRRTNILFLTQVFGNGVPRQLRSNLSLVLLFAQKNQKIRESAAQEFSSFISAERFQALWEDATQEPHGFLFCDFEAKPELRFRKGFTRPYLIAPDGQPALFTGA